MARWSGAFWGGDTCRDWMKHRNYIKRIRMAAYGGMGWGRRMQIVDPEKTD